MPPQTVQTDLTSAVRPIDRELELVRRFAASTVALYRVGGAVPVPPRVGGLVHSFLTEFVLSHYLRQVDREDGELAMLRRRLAARAEGLRRDVASDEPGAATSVAWTALAVAELVERIAALNDRTAGRGRPHAPVEACTQAQNVVMVLEECRVLHDA